MLGQARRAPQLCPRHADARVEVRHHPVRSERQHGTARRQVRRAEATLVATRRETVDPRARRRRLVEALDVQRLHRRGHAEGGEAGEILIGQRLDVLDAMHAAPWPARGLVGIERPAHGTIAHGVRDRAEARLREAAHERGVAPHIRPERFRVHAARTWLDEPGRTRLEHTVKEELRGPGAPQPAMLGGETETPLHLFIVDRRLLVHRHQQPDGQVAARLEGAADVEQLRIADHHVRSGETDAG